MKKHCLIFFVFLVLYSCTGDELTDKEFDGYYHPVERISLEFKSGRRVIGRIRSTEFVGRFHDKIYGHYDYAFPNVYISWDRSALENQVYRKKPALSNRAGSACSAAAVPVLMVSAALTDLY